MQIYYTWAWFTKALHVLKHVQHMCWRHLQKNVQLLPLRIEVGKTVYFEFSVFLGWRIYRIGILEYAVNLGVFAAIVIASQYIHWRGRCKSLYTHWLLSGGWHTGTINYNTENRFWHKYSWNIDKQPYQAGAAQGTDLGCSQCYNVQNQPLHKSSIQRGNWMTQTQVLWAPPKSNRSHCLYSCANCWARQGVYQLFGVNSKGFGVPPKCTSHSGHCSHHPCSGDQVCTLDFCCSSARTCCQERFSFVLHFAFCHLLFTSSAILFVF